MEVDISVLPSLAIFFVSFLGALALMPPFLRRLRNRGLVVPDVYKQDQPMLVTHAGILALGFAVVGLFVTAVLAPRPYLLWSAPSQLGDPAVAAELALVTICGYGVIGAIDDRRSLSHLTKAAVPLTLSLPCVALTISRSFNNPILSWFPGLARNPGLVFLIVVPVYILVVSNLINMHSGFNGLQSGLSLLLLGTLVLRFAWEGTLDGNLALLIVFGCTAAFYPFNRYPARAIEGNVGSFLVGAAIGVGIVTNGLFLAGVIMLAPHILDFLLFAFVKASRRPFIKYAKVRPDGTILAPYPFKLKFLLPYYFSLTERQTVWWLYLLTAVCCGLSLFIPV